MHCNTCNISAARKLFYALHFIHVHSLGFQLWALRGAVGACSLQLLLWAAPMLNSKPVGYPWSWWQWQVSGGAQGGEDAPAPRSCLATRQTACLRAASHNAAKTPHLESTTLCSHYFGNRNCPYQLFRVTPKEKCMLCYTLLLSASGTSNLFSCQHWFIKQHMEV